jgi:hypothetical protein
VAVTEYVPPAAVVAAVIVGFWLVEEKLLGPVQLKDVPVLLAPRLMFCPAHIGEFAVAVGAAGIGFTTTATVPAGPVHPAAVAVTEYTPAATVPAEVIVGF